jgi:hypothetical protein
MRLREVGIGGAGSVVDGIAAPAVAAALVPVVLLDLSRFFGPPRCVHRLQVIP